MMGNKKLSTIKAELFDQLSKKHKDSFQWLETKIRSAQRKKPVSRLEVETFQKMLESLREEANRRDKRGKSRRKKLVSSP